MLPLLIKILANIDSMSECRAREMTNIAKMLSASPILIGSRTRNSNMEEGIVYERYGVPAVTPETFEIEIFATPKKLYGVESVTGELEKRVLERLMRIGFQVYPTKKAPFSALTQDEEEVMLTKVVKLGLRKLLERARILKSISETVKTGAFFVIDSSRDFKKNIEGIPVIKKEELENIDKSDELLDTLSERAQLSKRTN